MQEFNGCTSSSDCPGTSTKQREYRYNGPSRACSCEFGGPCGGSRSRCSCPGCSSGTGPGCCWSSSGCCSRSGATTAAGGGDGARGYAGVGDNYGTTGGESEQRWRQVYRCAG